MKIYFKYSLTVQKKVFVKNYSARQCSKPLTTFIDRITDQRFGRTCSRFYNTFKWNRVLVEPERIQESILEYLTEDIYVNDPAENSGLSLIVFPW